MKKSLSIHTQQHAGIYIAARVLLLRWWLLRQTYLRVCVCVTSQFGLSRLLEASVWQWNEDDTFPITWPCTTEGNDSNALRNKEDFSSFAFVNDSSSSSLLGVQVLLRCWHGSRSGRKEKANCTQVEKNKERSRTVTFLPEPRWGSVEIRALAIWPTQAIRPESLGIERVSLHLYGTATTISANNKHK